MREHLYAADKIDEIAREYSPLVTHISYKMIENREIAKEAAQEAWIEIMKSIPGFRGTSKLSTWIYTIASRTIGRYAKNELRYSVPFIVEYMTADEIEYPYESEHDRKQWVKEMCDKCITASIHCLTNEERLVYLLYDVACLKSSEIENITSTSRESIRKSMSRNRKKLHSFLNDQCILYNPNGNCSCRMVRNVKEVNLHKEFLSIQNDIRHISFLLQCKNVLSPEDDFLREICHRYMISSTH